MFKPLEVDPPKPKRVVYIVLPWHETLVGLQRHVASIATPWLQLLHSRFGLDLEFRVAWAKGGTPLMFQLRHLSHGMVGRLG